jgi:hypothetical protein
MTKRTATVTQCIINILRENPNIDDQKLFDKVKAYFDEKNIKNKSENKDAGGRIQKLTPSEYNRALDVLIKKEQVAFWFELDKISYKDYRKFSKKINKQYIHCHFKLIDTSVHRAIIDKTVLAIKSVNTRGIVKLIGTDYKHKDYAVSKIEMLDNDSNTINVEFYEFNKKENAESFYNSKIKFNSDEPYSSFGIRKDAQFKYLICSLPKDKSKPFMGYATKDITLFSVMFFNNYVICFNMIAVDEEYIFNIEQRIFDAISKKKID